MSCKTRLLSFIIAIIQRTPQQEQPIISTPFQQHNLWHYIIHSIDSCRILASPLSQDDYHNSLGVIETIYSSILLAIPRHLCHSLLTFTTRCSVPRISDLYSLLSIEAFQASHRIKHRSVAVPVLSYRIASCVFPAILAISRRPLCWKLYVPQLFVCRRLLALQQRPPFPGSSY